MSRDRNLIYSSQKYVPIPPPKKKSSMCLPFFISTGVLSLFCGVILFKLILPPKDKRITWNYFKCDAFGN